MVANERQRTEASSESAAQPFIGTPPPPPTLDVQFQSPRYREQPRIEGDMVTWMPSYTNVTRKAEAILGRVFVYRRSIGVVHVMVLNDGMDSMHFAMGGSLPILATDIPSIRFRRSRHRKSLLTCHHCTTWPPSAPVRISRIAFPRRTHWQSQERRLV